MVLRRPAHPWPVSPRPCKKIMEAVCLILDLRITGFRDILRSSISAHKEVILLDPKLIPRDPNSASFWAMGKNDKSGTPLVASSLFRRMFLALYLM